MTACVHGLILLLALSGAAPAEGPSRKREAAQLRAELRHVTVLVREDLRASGPVPARGRATELEDGSVHVHADAGVVFEQLAPARLAKLALRGGDRLLVRLRPPSDLRPELGPGSHEGADPWDLPAWKVAPEVGPERGAQLSVLLELAEGASLREALSSLVFLPGETPSEAERAACLARYPEQDPARAAMRCGLPAKR